MLIIINTDGDSGMQTPEGMQCEPFLSDYSEEYALWIKKEEINEFATNWYNRKFGLTDRVFEALTYIIPDVLSSLHNEIQEKFENGNYSIRLVDNFRFYGL